MTKKQKKIFKIVIICLAVFLVAEIIFFGVRYYKGRNSSTFYTVINSVVMLDKGYVGAGFSDYKNSSFNDYAEGYNKATIFVNDGSKQIDEVSFNRGYNSSFNDIVKVSDGYIAVGKVEMTKEQRDDKLSEGLVIKYDKSFNVVWRKNFAFLGATDLLKVKALKSGSIVVVGTSVYGEGYVGNHTSGGGILLKLDKSGKTLLKVNNGGPYSGRFNDVIVESDGYVVVGLGKSNSGIIIKYNKSGKKLYSNSYGYTDKNGISSIDKSGNDYIVGTTKVININDLSNYQAAIVKYNSKLKKIDDVKYNSSNITYFSDVKVLDDKSIVACGYTGKTKGEVLNTNAIVVKYDKDLYEEFDNKITGDNNEYYNNIYVDGKYILLLGYSNSDLKDGFNGYDYFPFIDVYNSKLKISKD